MSYIQARHIEVGDVFSARADSAPQRALEVKHNADYWDEYAHVTVEYRPGQESDVVRHFVAETPVVKFERMSDIEQVVEFVRAGDGAMVIELDGVFYASEIVQGRWSGL